MKLRMTFWILFLGFSGFRIGFPPFPPEALDPQLPYHYRGAAIGLGCGILVGLLMQRFFGRKTSR